MFVETMGGMSPNYLPLSHSDNDPPWKKMLHLENVNLGIVGERCTSRWKRGISFQMPPLERRHRNKFLCCCCKKNTFATRLFHCFHNRWWGPRLYCNSSGHKLVRPQMKSTAFFHKQAWVIVNSGTSDRKHSCLEKLQRPKMKLINRFLF